MRRAAQIDRDNQVYLSAEQQVGDRLRQLRRSYDLTLMQVGVEIGVTAQMMSRWEKSAVIPSMINVARLAVFYGVTTDYLIKPLLDELQKQD